MKKQRPQFNKKLAKRQLPQRLKAYRKRLARQAYLLKRHNKRMTRRLKAII